MSARTSMIDQAGLLALAPDPRTRVNLSPAPGTPRLSGSSATVHDARLRLWRGRRGSPALGSLGFGVASSYRR